MEISQKVQEQLDRIGDWMPVDTGYLRHRMSGEEIWLCGDGAWRYFSHPADRSGMEASGPDQTSLFLFCQMMADQTDYHDIQREMEDARGQQPPVGCSSPSPDVETPYDGELPF